MNTRPTSGSLYHFFPGGEVELTAETLRWAGARYQELVETIFDASLDTVRGVMNVFEGAAATLETPDYADACPIATAALEVASTNESLRMVTHEIFAAWLEAATARFVSAGIDTARAHELAVLTVAALEGGFLLSRVSKSIEPMRTLGRWVAGAVEDALPSKRCRARGGGRRTGR
jgi:AcrR family transcriptional regulator